MSKYLFTKEVFVRSTPTNFPEDKGKVELFVMKDIRTNEEIYMFKTLILTKHPERYKKDLKVVKTFKDYYLMQIRYGIKTTTMHTLFKKLINQA